MGTIGLSRTNRLFWLGRYLERVYTTLKTTRGMFDAETDGAEADYKDYCRRMGIACRYEIRPPLSAATILMRETQIPLPRHWHMLMITLLYCAKRFPAIRWLMCRWL